MKKSLFFVATLLFILSYGVFHFGWATARASTIAYAIPVVDAVSAEPIDPNNPGGMNPPTELWDRIPSKVVLHYHGERNSSGPVSISLWRVSEDGLFRSYLTGLGKSLPINTYLHWLELATDKKSIIAHVLVWEWGIKFGGKTYQLG